METAKQDELQKLIKTHSRWQTHAEQPLHPTSLQQLLGNEIAVIRVSEFLSTKVTSELERSELIQSVFKSGHAFGPRLEAFQTNQLLQYQKAAQEASKQLTRAQTKNFELVSEIIELLSSSARQNVRLVGTDSEPGFSGHVRKLHVSENFTPTIPHDPFRFLEKSDAHLKWMIPLCLENASAELKIQHQTEESTRIKMLAGDLILFNSHNAAEVTGLEVVIAEGWVARLPSGELVLFS